jgi:hypothetical protein
MCVNFTLNNFCFWFPGVNSTKQIFFTIFAIKLGRFEVSTNLVASIAKIGKQRKVKIGRIDSRMPFCSSFVLYKTFVKLRALVRSSG